MAKGGEQIAGPAWVREMLSQAFFSPLTIYDWPAFLFGQPGLLSLEQDEAFDIFVRAAIAAEALHPAEAEGRKPLAWLLGAKGKAAVLAQVLGSLRADRPFLFNRVLLSLGGVREGKVKPADYELLEDFLAAALATPAELREAAGHEMDTLYRRALKAAGLDPDEPPAALDREVEKVLASPEINDIASEVELLAWLDVGEGLPEEPAAPAAAVMAEVWRRWCGAVTGALPDVALLARLLPELGLTSEELALMAPVDRETSHQLSAQCPYCGQTATMALGSQVRQMGGCPHFIYMGTGDEMHVLTLLDNYDLGADFNELLMSYYHSPGDHDIFATIVNDLYEMLSHQGRLKETPVACASAPRSFYFLRAYFKGDADQDEATRH